MDEWLPAVLGCIWGALAGPRLALARRRGPVALALGALAVGALAALVSGELAASVLFVAVDAAIAIAGTAVGVALARGVLPRLARRVATARSSTPG
jgi:hypothetical protein